MDYSQTPEHPKCLPWVYDLGLTPKEIGHWLNTLQHVVPSCCLSTLVEMGCKIHSSMACGLPVLNNLFT